LKQLLDGARVLARTSPEAAPDRAENREKPHASRRLVMDGRASALDPVGTPPIDLADDSPRLIV
jgi:hypothetical protein